MNPLFYTILILNVVLTTKKCIFNYKIYIFIYITLYRSVVPITFLLSSTKLKKYILQRSEVTLGGRNYIIFDYSVVYLLLKPYLR